MKGSMHEKRIENWLNEIGIVNNIQNLEEIRSKNFLLLKKYATKSGFFNRFESDFKRLVCYDKYPKFIKTILQSLKKKLGLSREHPK